METPLPAALRQLFARDVTAALATCAGCGRTRPVGALLEYGQAMGVILRCPACDTAMLRVVQTPTWLSVDASGMTLLMIRRRRALWHTATIIYWRHDMNAALFYRIAAGLLLLFAVAHTLGFRQSDPHGELIRCLAQCGQFTSMCRGSTAHIGTSFCGRILRRRVLFLRGDIGVAARWPSGRDFGGHARHCVGLRSLLCRHHGCELEIPLYPPYRLFHRDYSLFDCGGMAFSEANLKQFVRVCSRLQQPGDRR